MRYQPQASPLGNDMSIGLAKALYQAHNVDVIHAHSHLYFATNLVALKRQFEDTPMAITNHGLYSQSAPKWVFDLYLSTLGRWTFNQADTIFCYTETDQKRVRELGVTSQIEVIQNGIDTSQFTPTGAESEYINTAGPVVLFVGRLVKGKQPEIAVEAFEEIVSEYPDAMLYFCGEGPLYEKLKSQVDKAGLNGSVTFLGHVSYDEMPKIYRSSDVLLLPSKAEGMPRTVLEALASGLQVVMSDLEQVSNTLGAEVHTVEENDSDAFAKALSTALSRQQTSDEQPPIIKDYQWERTVNETTAQLLSLVDNREEQIIH